MAQDPLLRAMADAGIVCRCCLNSRASDYRGDPLAPTPCPVCAVRSTAAGTAIAWAANWLRFDSGAMLDIVPNETRQDFAKRLSRALSDALVAAWERDCHENPEDHAAPVAPPAQPADGMRAALAGLVALFAEPDESHIAQFERVGELFRRDTGMLRPGKDEPIGYGPTYEEREATYAAWFRAKVDAARSALAAAPAVPAQPTREVDSFGRDLREAALAAMIRQLARRADEEHRKRALTLLRLYGLLGSPLRSDAAPEREGGASCG